jgi:hypothetical protein
MLIRDFSFRSGLVLFLVLVIFSSSSQAQVEPDRSGIAQAEFRLDELDIQHSFQSTKQLPAQAASNAKRDLSLLGLSEEAGLIDVRSGRWATLMLSEPLIPGKGKGNTLSWASLGQTAPANAAAIKSAAAQAFQNFVGVASKELRINKDEFGSDSKVTLHGNGQTIQIYSPRVHDGVKVRGSYVTASINNGNLTLLGANNWGDINVSTNPAITTGEALEIIQAHVRGYPVTGSWGKPELTLVPVQTGQNPNQNPVGQGYAHRLAWVIRPSFDNVNQNYEALVDAHNSELLSFQDTNQYASTLREVSGGVQPVTNDGIVPDGVEQAGWPMPFDNVTTPSGTVTTDSGGNLPAPVDGNITSTLNGKYVRINDNCGAASLTSAGDIDFGTSAGTDCTTPGIGGAGNTHAARTGFYELNRIIEMGRSQLPTNSWLQQQLTSNMNINQTCNAFWSGSVNFYRSGDGCFNTGEIAGVFDHEWGHGLDDNDAVPNISSPSGEGIADVYAALRLNSSCIGRNFRASVCSGFGDACLSCTGVRDIDYLQRASGQPHDYTWSNANCGGSVHCVGSVYSEAIWSLWKRELQAAPYNYDNNTATEIVTRLTYIGAGNTGTWFAGGAPNGGCAATSGYMNFLAADDDNGTLLDGTPHMTAIYDAFNAQEIACQTPPVQDSGCSATPSAAPLVTASPLDKSASLSWGAVTNASSYEVFRTDGVFGCDFGKVRVGETVGNSFSDAGLQNGRDYSYVVIPKGSEAACFGPSSSCTTVTPAAGPNIDIDADSGQLVNLTGDGDEFIDNCEDASLTFTVSNTGIVDLTNVRITGVSVISPAGTTISTTFPIAVSPAAVNVGQAGSGSFEFNATGLSFGDELVFDVSYTSDEIFPTIKTKTLTLQNAESDKLFVASKTWDFETDLEGWSVIQGTFNQTSAGGGANGSSGYVASSANLDNQCDQIRSPLLQLTASSTLTLANNYEIEANSGQWWDIANVAVFEDSNRSSVNPDGGRTYNASGEGASCVTAGQNGWAAVNGTWGSSSWSATALDSVSYAGSPVQLDIAYGTDVSVNGKGFWFDQVTITDIELLVADAQTDVCAVPTNSAPVVTITSPADASEVGEGINVNFTGTAIDDEDGDISANIAWSSDVDGSLGTGASINTAALTAGAHVIMAAVTDSGDPTGIPETSSAQISINIVINNPPVVTITAPADASVIGEGININFTSTSIDDEDGANTANILWSSDVDGPFAVGANINIASLTAGAHIITAEATDSGDPTGIPETSSAQIGITIVTNTAPVVTITSPANASEVGEGINVNFTATATDDEDGDISANIAWSSDVDGPLGTGASINTTSLTAGAHIITAAVTDSGDPTASPESDSAQISITIVTNAAPVVTITAPADASEVGEGIDINFTGTAIDDEDGDISADITWSSDVDGPLGSGASINTASLSLGAHTITAEVTDSGDPTASPESDSAQISITIVTNAAPVVTITSPADASEVGEGIDINFTGTAIDDEDGDISADITWSSDVDGPLGSGASITTAALTAGAHIITAEVTDSGDPTASPESGSAQISITIVTNTAPVVTITSPADATEVGEGININFTATAIDDEDGDISADIAWSSDVDGPLGSGASINTAALTAGAHTITAEVTDSGDPTASPESGSAQISITIVTNTAPVVTITSPAGVFKMGEGININFTGTAIDDEDGDISTNIAWSSDVDGPLGTGAGINTASLSLGAHIITAEVTDSGDPSASPESDSAQISITILTIEVYNLLFDDSFE